MFRTKLNEVLASKRSFISDRLNLAGFGLAALLNIIHWTVLYSKIKPTDENILLHYNVVYGSQLVSKSLYVYLIPLLALILLGINLAVASSFYEKEKLSSYFFSFASVAVQLIFLIGTLVLITANA